MLAETDLAFLDADVARWLAHDPDFRLRRNQKPPAADWHTWLLLGGRGAGKTRAGAEWIHDLASTAASPLRLALVAETLGDAREVMIDGDSGIMRVARRNRPDFEITRRRLVWPNGSVAHVFSSEDPESLRGPQFHFAWCDELAKWKHGEDTWDMLQFALRLGDDPRQMVTTTPRPTALIRRLVAEPATVTVRMRSADNVANLAPGFLAAVSARYAGTRLGRQELDGEIIADRPDALWSRGLIEACRIRQAGPFERIVIGVDPPAGHGEGSVCGIVAAGLEASGRGVVLADCSVVSATPAGWGEAVAATFRRFDADRVVVEINQGGDMVESVLRSIDESLPIQPVRALRGKYLRAEPVAALYEQGRVAHLSGPGRDLAALEDQMADFAPGGLSSGASPDRLDALVWALSSLMLRPRANPRIRGL